MTAVLLGVLLGLGARHPPLFGPPPPTPTRLVAKGLPTMSRTYTYTRTQTDLCQRCEHPADWHRHDDTSPPYLNGHNSHGAILGEDAECPYRCIGYDCTTDGPIPSAGCSCPDMVRADD